MARRPRLRSALLVLTLAATSGVPVACSSDLVTEADGFTARVVLTRQRDLVDRGLVNVFTRNDTGSDVVVRRRGLVLSAFDTPAPVERRSRLVAGTEVALQIGYGEVVDCDLTRPVSGSVELAYTVGDDDRLHEVSVPLDDATVLDDIRANACTARLVAEEADARIDEPRLDGEVVTATLAIDRTEDGPELEIRSLGGTVLFGVQPVDAAVLPIELGTDPATVRVPIEITVNRCDPHALAETTKRYAVDLRVSVDGADPRKVPLDVDDLVPLLEQALERCRERSSADG